MTALRIPVQPDLIRHVFYLTADNERLCVRRDSVFHLLLAQFKHEFCLVKTSPDDTLRIVTKHRVMVEWQKCPNHTDTISLYELEKRANLLREQKEREAASV